MLTANAAAAIAATPITVANPTNTAFLFFRRKSNTRRIVGSNLVPSSLASCLIAFTNGIIAGTRSSRIALPIDSNAGMPFVMTKFMNFSTTGASREPISIHSTATLALIFAIESDRPSDMVLKAASVAPLEFFISSKAALNPFACGPVIARAAFIASTEPKRSLNSCSGIELRRSLKIPPTFPPPLINSANDSPVRSLSALSSCDPPFDASTRAARSWVVATEVGVPWAVIRARDAVISSNPTPNDAAVGTTLNNDRESWSKSVLPNFTAVNMRSEAVVASMTSAP